MDSREYARTVWNSRRCMHEIDVMLDPFVKDDLLKLDEKRQREYVHLLERTDLELINFLVRGADAEDEETRDIVGVIRECHRNRMRKAEKEGLSEEQ